MNQKLGIEKIVLRILFVLGIFVITALPRPIYSAELRITSVRENVINGQQLPIKILLDSPSDAINAFEARIAYSPDRLTFIDWSDTGAIVNFWIEKPGEKNGTITMSGVVPGGYQGTNGLIATLYFRATQEGPTAITFRDTTILLNDGAGTQAKSSFKNFALTVVPQDKNTSASRFPLFTPDQDPPEPFMPEIARDPSLFEGKRFLVFITQDKGTGIDHYEIKESPHGTFSLFRRWHHAESPYVLQDQELRSFISVKAVDKNGNARTAKISPSNPLPWYKNSVNWLILTMGILAVLIAKKLWRGKYIIHS